MYVGRWLQCLNYAEKKVCGKQGIPVTIYEECTYVVRWLQCLNYAVKKLCGKQGMPVLT